MLPETTHITNGDNRYDKIKRTKRRNANKRYVKIYRRFVELSKIELEGMSLDPKCIYERLADEYGVSKRTIFNAISFGRER